MRAWTGVDLSPEEIHREALVEVQRRQIELAEMAKNLGFSGNYNDFVRSLADTPQCAPRVLDADGVRVRFQSLLQQAQQGLPKLFATIRRLLLRSNQVRAVQPLCPVDRLRQGRWRRAARGASA